MVSLANVGKILEKLLVRKNARINIVFQAEGLSCLVLRAESYIFYLDGMQQP